MDTLETILEPLFLITPLSGEHVISPLDCIPTKAA
jgi:hypothetical protein